MQIKKIKSFESFLRCVSLNNKMKRLCIGNEEMQSEKEREKGGGRKTNNNNQAKLKIKKSIT